MKLTKVKLTAINVSSLAVLAPLMIELSNHLPAKYLWLAPIIVQGANWLLAHKALNTPTPNLISRLQLRTILEMSHERTVDPDEISRQIANKCAHELSRFEAHKVIQKLKATNRRPAAIPVVDDESR